MQQTVSHSFSNTLRVSPCECLRRVLVPDRVRGRWKRPGPEHTEGPARQLHEEDNLPQTWKKQATSATATSAETSTSRRTLDEHWPVVYRNTTSPVKQTRL